MLLAPLQNEVSPHLDPEMARGVAPCQRNAHLLLMIHDGPSSAAGIAFLTICEMHCVHFDAAWKELWNELHHQGDVGEASYAAIPKLVHIHAERGIADSNTYALVAIIEDARKNPKNPELPS